MKNKYCPFCGKKTLRFIEKCDSNDDEVKTSWTCDCGVNFVLYIYIFVENSKDNIVCPDCGSKEIRLCPLDNYDYICHDCGLFFNKEEEDAKEDNL